MIFFPMNAIKDKNLKGCCLGAVCFYNVYKQGQRNHGHTIHEYTDSLAEIMFQLLIHQMIVSYLFIYYVKNQRTKRDKDRPYVIVLRQIGHSFIDLFQSRLYNQLQFEHSLEMENGYQLRLFQISLTKLFYNKEF